MAVWGAQASFVVNATWPSTGASKCHALDTWPLGLNTHIIKDGCRGIELESGDIDRALDEMKRAGAVLLKSSDL